MSARVEVTTAIVEVRMVTVNRKSMTLSLYNQIPMIHPADMRELWGWVNRCPTRCPFAGLDDHTHVLGASGDGELAMGYYDHSTDRYMPEGWSYPDLRDTIPQLYIAR